jgi:hypothetical protein
VSRSKIIDSNQESINLEDNITQDLSIEKNKNMKQSGSSPQAAIPTKKRFEVLQPRETSLPQSQKHPQTTSTQKPASPNSIMEYIQNKNANLRCRTNKHTTSQVVISHDKEETTNVRRGTPPASPSKQTTPRTRPPQTDKPKEIGPPAAPSRGQTHQGQPTSCPTEERADTEATTKSDRPPPINISLQDPKDTVALIEKILNIKQFHIKRIHAGKHTLFLHNLTDYNKAKEILIAANSLLQVHTKIRKTPHIPTKRPGQQLRRDRNTH